MVRALNGLAAISAQLNEKSDHLNKTIAKFNEKLTALNLGIEAWLTDRPLKQAEFRDRSTATVGWRSAEAFLLGYARVEDEWQLAFKQATLNEYHEDDGREWTEVSDSSTPIPLLKASRPIRMKAMGALESLLIKIQTEASIMLSGIEAAEDAAEKL
jgi:hypothetical protein